LDDDDEEELANHVVYDKPNRPRWKGSVNKWKRYTHSERQLAQSLELLEAEDLSVHLYDSFSLSRRNYAQDFQPSKRRGLEPTQNAEQQYKQHHRKERWLIPGAWAPGAKWTAWPLSLDEVPTEEETFTQGFSDRLDDGALQLPQENYKPSRWMEEVILAEVQRRSRQRCYKRGIGAGEAVEGQSRKRRRVEAGHDEDGHIGQEDEDNEDDEDMAFLEPVILADDEKAAHVLQPVIRHVLQKVDDLLMGLHDSRRNHLDFDSSDSGTDSQTSRHSSLRRRSRSRSRSARKGGRSASRRPSREDGEESYNQKYLLPRDWSEVLGIASMVGWDPEVIKRASARCNDLFGERMEFRTLHEGAGEAITVQASAPQPLRISTSRTRNSRSRSGFSSGVGEESSAAWLCPEEDCVRHTKPFNARWRVHDHVKRTHGYVYVAPPSRAQSEAGTGEATASITTIGKGLCCPITTCKRYSEPYGSRWRLNEHMKRNHKQKKSQPSAPTSDGETTEEASGVTDKSEVEFSAEELIGGVHEDGFMKPIKARASWTEGRSGRAGLQSKQMAGRGQRKSNERAVSAKIGPDESG